MSFSDNHLPASNNIIKCVFKGYRERYAILENEEGKEILWPIEKFPKNISQGDKIEMSLKTKEDLKSEIFEAKRKLLEELIN